MLDGLLYGCGDAVVGVNPATDNTFGLIRLLEMLDEVRERFDIPTQSCVLAHVTNTIRAIEQGAPVDLVFQSIAGTEKANAVFGIDLALLREAREAALSLGRGTVGDNVMYFETGQGSALSAEGNFGVDQQTCEARAYGVAREFKPLLTNTVVGFYRPRVFIRRQADYTSGIGRSFLWQAPGRPPWVRYMLHQSCRGGPG